MAKAKVKFGPTFGDEVNAAGLGGLPLSWGADGTISADSLTADQLNKLNTVVAAHDPTKPAARPLVT